MLQQQKSEQKVKQNSSEEMRSNDCAKDNNSEDRDVVVDHKQIFNVIDNLKSTIRTDLDENHMSIRHKIIN